MLVTMTEGIAEGKKLLEGLKIVRSRYLVCSQQKICSFILSCLPLKATKNILVKSTAKEIAKTFVVSKDLPDFESYLSLEKIEEVIYLHSYSGQKLF